MLNHIKRGPGPWSFARPRPEPSHECIVAELLDSAAAGDCIKLGALIAGRAALVDSKQWTPRRILPEVANYWPSWAAEADCQAVHIAAAHGRLEAVRLLLQMGASPLAATRNCITPLHLAAFCGFDAVVAELIMAMPRQDGRPVADDAAVHGNVSESGPTALHLACCGGGQVVCTGEEAPRSVDHARVVQLLVAAGASPEHRVCIPHAMLRCAALLCAGALTRYMPGASPHALMHALSRSVRAGSSSSAACASTGGQHLAVTPLHLAASAHRPVT